MSKALEASLAAIKKKYGDDAIRMMSDLAELTVIPTGCLSVDIILGVGGWPRGRIIEVYGVPKGGKSTLILHAVAEAQKHNLPVAYIDAEHALYPPYMRIVGVNTDTLHYVDPLSGEQGLEIAEILIRSGEMGLIVVDSVDALLPQSVLDGEMGDAHYAPLPRLMGQGLRKLKSIVRKSNTCLIMINQERMKMGGQSGPQKTTSGGFALKYYADVRMEVVRIGTLKDDDEEIIGHRTKINVVASKVALPQHCEMDLIYGKGFWIEADIVDAGVKARIIEKSGAWYSYKGDRLGQGRAAAAKMLTTNPETTAAIVAAVREVRGLTDAASV